MGLPLVLPAGLERPASAQCQYEVTIIQGPECGIFGPAPTTGQGLGEDGAVVGYYNECLTTNRAYRWTPETGVQELEFPIPTLRSRAYDIAGDWIVGEYDVSGDDFEKVGFVFNGDEFIALPMPKGGNLAEVLATNGSRAVGYWQNTFSGPIHAFVFEDGEFIDINRDLNPRGGFSEARAINVHGQVTGACSHSGVQRAFIWGNGRVVTLPAIPGGCSSHGRGINDRGDVVGLGILAAPCAPDGAVARGFVWSEETMTVVEPFPGFPNARLFDINNVRQAVGESYSTIQEAFIWQHGQKTKLDDLIPREPALKVKNAWEIDDQGRIVGTANLVGKAEVVAVVLTPIAKPPGDIDNDCTVGPSDLALLLEQWGRRGSFADLNGDDMVDPHDLAILLGNWGARSPQGARKVSRREANSRPEATRRASLMNAGTSCLMERTL